MIRNFFSMSFMRIASAAMTLLMVISIARVWGLELLGGFSLLLATFLSFQLLPLLGLNLYLIREVAARPSCAHEHAATAAAVSSCVSLALFVAIGWGGGQLYPERPELENAFWITAACLLPTAMIVVAESILLARQLMPLVARVNIVESMVRTIATIVIVHIGGSISHVMLVFLLCRVGAMGTYLCHPEVPPLIAPRKVSCQMARRYVAVLPTFFGIAICSALAPRLDVLVLSKLARPIELGLYASPVRLFELAQMVPQILMVVALPRIVVLWKSRPDDVPWLAAGLVAGPLMVLAPGLILACAHSETLLAMFGSEATLGAPALMWLLPGVLFVGMGQILAACMLAADRSDLDLRALAVSCGLSLIGLLVAIPRWGATGAAAVTFTVIVLSVLLRLALLRDHMDLRPIVDTWLWGVVPVVGMGATLWATPNAGPVLSTGVSLMVFTALFALVLHFQRARWRQVFTALFGAGNPSVRIPVLRPPASAPTAATGTSPTP